MKNSAGDVFKVVSVKELSLHSVTIVFWGLNRVLSCILSFPHDSKMKRFLTAVGMLLASMVIATFSMEYCCGPENVEKVVGPLGHISCPNALCEWTCRTDL